MIGIASSMVEDCGSVTVIVPAVMAVPLTAGSTMMGRLDAVIADASQCAASRSTPVGIRAGRGIGVDPDWEVIK
jgi:hypothetical protein